MYCGVCKYMCDMDISTECENVYMYMCVYVGVVCVYKCACAYVSACVHEA